MRTVTTYVYLVCNYYYHFSQYFILFSAGLKDGKLVDAVLLEKKKMK